MKPAAVGDFVDGIACAFEQRQTGLEPLADDALDDGEPVGLVKSSAQDGAVDAEAFTLFLP